MGTKILDPQERMCQRSVAYMPSTIIRLQHFMDTVVHPISFIFRSNETSLCTVRIVIIVGVWKRNVDINESEEKRFYYTRLTCTMGSVDT